MVGSKKAAWDHVIEMYGVPKLHTSVLKLFLTEKLQHSRHRIQPVKKNSSNCIPVTFKDARDAEYAAAILNGLELEGSTLTVLLAGGPMNAELLERKRKLESASEVPSKTPKLEQTKLTKEEKLKNAVIPLADLPYPDQLKFKKDAVKAALKRIAEKLVQNNPDLSGYVEHLRQNMDGMACELSEVKYAQVFENCRNKCEFSIGFNEETKERTVGFRHFQKVGPGVVQATDSLKHLPKIFIEAAKVFQGFIQKSDKEPFDGRSRAGFWQQLVLRTSNLDELMVMVSVCSDNITEEELNKIKLDLKAFFLSEGQQLRVTSLFFHNTQKGKPAQDVQAVMPEHLAGETCILESVGGKKFHISPQSFFHPSTFAAEVLYNVVEDLVKPKKCMTLLDICCGVGTVGILLAGKCGQVLGLECQPHAVNDAKENIRLNGVTNYEIFHGKVEHALSAAKEKITCDEVVAVIDPPRVGIYAATVSELRSIQKLNRIVYIAIDPNEAKKNLGQFCRPPAVASEGYPFVPIQAVPVDMYPLASHCQLVIYLERRNPSTLQKATPPTPIAKPKAAAPMTVTPTVATPTPTSAALVKEEDLIVEAAAQLFDYEVKKSKAVVTNKLHQLYYKIADVDWSKALEDEFVKAAHALFTQLITKFPILKKGKIQAVKKQAMAGQNQVKTGVLRKPVKRLGTQGGPAQKSPRKFPNAFGMSMEQPGQLGAKRPSIMGRGQMGRRFMNESFPSASGLNRSPPAPQRDLSDIRDLVASEVRKVLGGGRPMEPEMDDMFHDARQLNSDFKDGYDRPRAQGSNASSNFLRDTYNARAEEFSSEKYGADAKFNFPVPAKQALLSLRNGKPMPPSMLGRPLGGPRRDVPPLDIFTRRNEPNMHLGGPRWQ